MSHPILEKQSYPHQRQRLYICTPWVSMAYHAEVNMAYHAVVCMAYSAEVSMAYSAGVSVAHHA